MLKTAGGEILCGRFKKSLFLKQMCLEIIRKFYEDGVGTHMFGITNSFGSIVYFVQSIRCYFEICLVYVY